jgi:DNA-binding NarL/FixJ family response regulator
LNRHPHRDTLDDKRSHLTTNASYYRILLADGHVILRQGLKRILEENPGLEVIGEACDGIELLNLIKLSQLQPHMVILDISMPNLSGIEATRQIKMIRPDIKILILSMYKEKEYLSQAFTAGAEGYLLKQDADTELCSAIQTIKEGGVYISPYLSGKLQNGLE